ERVMTLFFNEPSKHWHFKDIVHQANISEPRASYWLQLLIKEGIVIYHKPKKKMPYYIANFDSIPYQIKKRMYGFNILADSGLFNYFQDYSSDAIIVFGSFSRGDWHTKSDIDICIIGYNKKIPIDHF